MERQTNQTRVDPINPGGVETPGVESQLSNPSSIPVSPDTAEAERKRVAEIEKEASYWRGVAEGRSAANIPQSHTPPVEPKAPKELKEPRFEDYETPAEYESARTTYIVDKAKLDTKKEMEADIKIREEKSKRDAVVASFTSRIRAASATDPEIFDIRDKLGKRVAPHTAQLIMESEVSPKILRYMYSNPTVVDELNSMSPLAAARYVGKIEASFIAALAPSNTAPATPKPANTSAPNTISNAPDPIPPVGGGSGTVLVDDEDKLSIDDWMRRRNKAVYG
jgi:hypothetical protein